MGRPSKFRDDMLQQAYHLCLLGATDADLARAFGVDEATINRWKQDHPAFRESLNDGKEAADARVAKALYSRAVGYMATKVKHATFEGSITDERTYEEAVGPDVTACIFWLKNRQSGRWRDKHDHEHSGKLTLEQILEQSSGRESDPP